MIDGSFLSDQEQHLKLNVVVVASGLFVEEQHLAVPALVAAEGHLAPVHEDVLALPKILAAAVAPPQEPIALTAGSHRHREPAAAVDDDAAVEYVRRPQVRAPAGDDAGVAL